MRKKILAILLIIVSFSLSLNASPANTDPIVVTQPDGTTITVQMHGDEFLSWMTCGNSLVAQGEDGWWYYATFDADGNSIPGSQKVSASVVRQAAGTSQSTVVPPASAIEKANATRAERYSRRSTVNSGAAKGAPIQAGSISIGSDKRFLVILVDFSDLKFSVNGGGSGSHTAFDNQMNQQGYSANGAIGSAKDYFMENSSSQFVPQFDVYGPVTASRSVSYYSADKGETQNGAPALLTEACRQLDASVDFSIYDIDKDGVIDGVFMYYAGHNQAEGASGTIWPHQWEVAGSVMLDGVKLKNYACSSELRGASGKNMAGIGTFCHEFGHVIGLPDFYDTDYNTNGKDIGLDYYSVMSMGTYNGEGKRPPYHNCEERYMLGWVNERPVPYGRETLSPIQNNDYFYVPTLTENEYYLYEFRNGTKWDTGLDKGVMIYHVDKSTNRVGSSTAAKQWTNNSVNAYADHPCMKLVCASDRYKPFGNDKYSFTETSNPSALDWAGRSINCDLNNISYNDNAATLDFAKGVLSGHVVDNNNNPVSGAEIYVYIQGAQSSPISLDNPAFPAPSTTVLVETLTTDNDGFFQVTSEKIGGKAITVTARKDGYQESYMSFTFSGSKDIVLQLYALGDYSTVLKKYINGDNTVEGVSRYAMKYTANELKPYVGKEVKSITFGAVRVGSESIYVFIQDADGNKLIEKDVTSLTKSSEIVTVDISDSEIKIPDSKDLYFGVRSTIRSTKFYCDSEGYGVSGGLYYYSSFGGWVAYSSINLMISVELENDDKEILSLSGIKYVDIPTESYNAGDTFTLSIDNSESSPYTAIKWEVNSVSQPDGGKVTLKTGITDIKATLTYPSGKKEVILMKIKVE